MTAKPNIWCDVDGVLAIYEPDAYTGDEPLYLKPNQHYFRNLTPDSRMIFTLKTLQRHGYPIHILTNICESPVKKEHETDKIEWIKKHLPFLTKDQFTILTIPKWQYVCQTRHTHSLKQQILISDFNQDLEPWTKQGGVGIKYLNGINSADSYPYDHIYPRQTPIDILASIQKISRRKKNQ